MVQANNESARTLGWIAIVLVVIGAVNWGLVGIFSFNLVEAIFGHLTTLSRIVYILVALAGLYLIYFAVQLSNDLKFVQPRQS